MSYPVLAPGARPCVWMCAGVIRYRLCTRDLDCENCLLDAALRAEYPSLADDAGDGPARLHDDIPRDRLYSSGHTWIKRRSDDDGVWRVGLDAFAAAVLAVPARIVWRRRDRLGRGDPLCHLDLGSGVLTLGSPVGGRWIRENGALRDDPGSLLSGSYHGGWIVELAAADPADLRELASPLLASRRIGRDLRRFRRAVAIRLLTEPVDGEPGSPPTRAPLTELRHLLGGERYVELLRDFLH